MDSELTQMMVQILRSLEVLQHLVEAAKGLQSPPEDLGTPLLKPFQILRRRLEVLATFLHANGARLEAALREDMRLEPVGGCLVCETWLRLGRMPTTCAFCGRGALREQSA